MCEGVNMFVMVGEGLFWRDIVGKAGRVSLWILFWGIRSFK